MSKLGICIISTLGEKTYAEKYFSLSDIHRPYWESNFLMHENRPVDVLDYYRISRDDYAGV